MRAAFLASILFSLGAVAEEGSFRALVYNVAGLPDLLSSSDPAVNTPLISPRLKDYDIINVQEDFNYHAALYASDGHLYRTPTSGGVPIGDGLNTMSHYPITHIIRTKWKDCNLNSGDCLTPKGFTLTRVQLTPNLPIDVYNLHTDAGSDDGDRTARNKNFAQLLAYINANSSGLPVLVMGDTNSRWTQTAETGLPAMASAGFDDAWVQAARGGIPPAGDALVCPFPFEAGTTQAQMQSCETVDKIFFRGSEAGGLALAQFVNRHESFVVDGKALSDHYPLEAEVKWNEGAAVRLSETVGGFHGTAFADKADVVQEVVLSGGNRVDRVAVRVASGVVAHGGSGGAEKVLALESGERIVEVKACEGKKDDHTRVFYVKVSTSAGRNIAVGTETSVCKTMAAPSGWTLGGWWGRAGDEVDILGAVWRK